jgi:hypothetical protein
VKHQPLWQHHGWQRKLQMEEMEKWWKQQQQQQDQKVG